MPRTSRRPITNAIEEFVYVVCRGPTRCAIHLQRSNQTIQRMVVRGTIEDEGTAVRWARVAIEQGRPDLTAEMFMGLVPWRGLGHGRHGTTTAQRRGAPLADPTARRRAPGVDA